MNILRGGKVKPFSVRKLTKEQEQKINKCEDMKCGLSGLFFKYVFNIPDLWFGFSCKKHDVATRRGGGLLDWFDNATGFALYLSIAVKGQIDNFNGYPIINILFVILIAIWYWILATLGTIFVFGWGRYKTFDEIMEKAERKTL